VYVAVRVILFWQEEILNKLEGQGRPIIISSEVKLPTLVLLKHTVYTTELFTSVLTLAKQNVYTR